MATNILRVHSYRDELREKLTVALDPEFRLAASDISGPGLALDFGDPRKPWGQIMWNDHTDTWDYLAAGESQRAAVEVEDAAAFVIREARARIKMIKCGMLEPDHSGSCSR